MGLFTYTIAGAGFILIGARESISSLNPDPITRSDSNTPPTKPEANTSLSCFAISMFSFLFIINSVISFFNAVNSSDRVGSALQLRILAIAALFLLYSVLGFLVKSPNSFHIPSTILNTILLFGFVEEFLLFYMQRKDSNGIENRYFDLLLVPISVCAFSVILELKSPISNYPRLVNGIGLILQGTWFLQMGVSFYTSLITDGCSLHEKSRGNFTVRCKGHPEYHRGRAIATLQFNCHLALIVVLAVGFYSAMARRYGDRSDFLRYRPLEAETEGVSNVGHFSLDSDEEDEIKEERNSTEKETASVEMTVNGFGSHD